MSVATAASLRTWWGFRAKTSPRFRHSTVTVEQLDDGRRKVLALIPDNPEARSKQKFRYAQRMDALSFGWRAANELLCIAGLVRGAQRDKMGV
jgi:hypothetical protein